MITEHLQALGMKFINARRERLKAEAAEVAAALQLEKARQATRDRIKESMEIIDSHRDKDLAAKHAVEYGKAVAAQRAAEAHHEQRANLLADAKHEEAECQEDLTLGCGLTQTK